MAAQIFPFGTALTVVWHLTKPDGTSFDLSGYTYRAYYRTGNKETLVNSSRLSASGNTLSISIPADEPVAPGEYALRLVLYQNQNLFCTLTYNAAFVLSRQLAKDPSNQTQEQAGNVVHLYTVAEFYLLQPVVPTVGDDGYWYVNGTKITDGSGEYIPSNHTVTYDPETNNIIIDQGRVDKDGQSIEQTITSLADALGVAANDHNTAVADHGTATSDHQQAGSDHTQASADHAQASSDHTTAAADHVTAAADHTTAASDHTRAGNDHTASEEATVRANAAAAAAEHQVDVKRGYSIESVTQPVVSTTNGGVNTIRVTTEDNKAFDFYVRNGKSSAGFFSTATALNTAIPSPNAGDYAFVSKAGDGTFPAYIYVCTTAGTWTATEAEYDGDSVDLTPYATKEQVNQLGQEVDELINGEIVSQTLHLQDIGIAWDGYYINSASGTLMSTSNCVVSDPIFLNIGDNVSCETGGTGIALFFSLPNGDPISSGTQATVISAANNYSGNTSYEATIDNAGWYGFSGRSNRSDGSNLSVTVIRYTRQDSLDDRFDAVSEQVDAVSEQVDAVSEQVDEVINGETTIHQYTLDDIDGDGALVDYYLDSSLNCPIGSQNCIITKPIYLNPGDHIECETGGTGLGLFAKSPSSTITQLTTGFETIKAANDYGHNTQYQQTINEAGWYVFSGRINRNDDTNLSVTVTQYTIGKSVYDLIDEKADKRDVNDLNIPSIGLSIGADTVIDSIPQSPWFAADADSNGLDYGTYLDDKLDSVPYGKRFIFITDVHYDGGNKKAAPLVDYARRRLGIKTIIHGGDVHNEAVTAQDAVAKWLSFNRDFVFRIGNDFKQVLGDHDRNGGTGHQPISYEVMQRLLDGYDSSELVFDNLYDQQVAELGWSASDMSQYNAFKRMHYFFDDVSIKTRFIVLVTRIIPQGQGLVYEKLGDYDTGVLLLQMDFLHYALTSLPSGYNVVVCGHNVIGNQAVEGHTGWYNTSVPIWKGYWRSVAKHIRAFKTKGVCNTSYLDWTSASITTKDFDYTGSGNAGLVFCYGGDVHWDILAKSQTTEEVLANVVSGSTIDKDNDILQVVTMTDGADRGYRDENGNLICNPATPGTIDSQAFDIVTIAEDAIYFTRIGSGDDRVVYLTTTA